MVRFPLPAAGVVLCLLGSVTTTSGHGQAQEPASKNDTAGLVHLFVIATDGRPVEDLLAEEVTLKVGGRERNVLSLRRFTAPAPGGKAPAPEPYATNRPPTDGRDVLIVVDNESFGAGRESFVQQVLAEVVSIVGPGDRLGLVTLPKGLVRLAPSADIASVKAALTEMIGRGMAVEAAADAACRSKATLDTLRQVVAGVARERLTVVTFVSGGLTPPTGMATVQRGTGAVATCELRNDDFTDTVAAIRSAPVDFHGVFVADDQASGSAPSSVLLTGLEHVAGATGNPLVRPTGRDGGAIAPIARRVASFYTVRFEAMAEDRTGEPARLEVKVLRPGVAVSVPATIVVPKAEPTARKAKGTAPDELLRVATTCSDVPLKAAAFPARGEDSRTVKVVTLFEAGEQGHALTAASIALYDDKGKMVAKGSARSEDLSRVPVVVGLQAKPGRYRLRVAAADAAGRCGTVDQSVDAALAQAGPLTFSSLVLGMPAGGRFTPVLEYIGTGSAIAYLEVYGVKDDAVLNATFELATSADGPAIAVLPVDVRMGGSPDLRIVLGEISLATLPPVDVVVRAVVGIQGQAPATISRTLRRR